MQQNTQDSRLHQRFVWADITQNHKNFNIYGFKLCLLQSFDGVRGGHLTKYLFELRSSIKNSISIHS